MRKVIWVILGIVGIPLLILFVVGQFTPVLTILILKQAIDRTSFAPPPDLKTIQENVIVEKDIRYNEQGTLLDIYRLKGATGPLPIIMWIHGGAFVGASKEQDLVYAMTLASHGYVVANINYDLAPGHKYPTPVVEGNQALAFLQENGKQYRGDINRIFLGSNSAGSQIASQLAAVISNREFAEQMGIEPAIRPDQLKGALLYDGTYDMQLVKTAGPPGGSLFLWAYTGQRDYRTFDRIDELSVVKHVTPDYPPVFLAVGDADPVEPQSLQLMEVLKENGVEVDAFLFTNTGAHLGHDYMMELDTEAAQKTLARALDFLERHSSLVQEQSS